MLGLKLNHVSKRGHRCQLCLSDRIRPILIYFFICLVCVSCYSFIYYKVYWIKFFRSTTAYLLHRNEQLPINNLNTSLSLIIYHLTIPSQICALFKFIYVEYCFLVFGLLAGWNFLKFISNQAGKLFHLTLREICFLCVPTRLTNIQWFWNHVKICYP